MGAFQSICGRMATTCLLALGLTVAFALPAHAGYLEGFEQGGTFFDDGVGVVHVRPSGSTAETDYAPGIAASQGSQYARLLVQAWLQNGCFTDTAGNSFCGINGSQAPGACKPGSLESDSGVNCDGPLTEWGLSYGNFDKGIPITGNGSTTSIDIYLDTNFASASQSASKDYRFDWDSDLLDNQGNFLQDYVFNVAIGDGHDGCAPAGGGGYFVIEASTASQRSGANAHSSSNGPQTCITQSGWYTFTHTFTKDQNGNLEVDMTVAPAQSKAPAGTWTLHSLCLNPQIADGACPSGSTTSTPLPFSAVGSNFLGWFPDQEINNLAIDNVSRNDL